MLRFRQSLGWVVVSLGAGMAAVMACGPFFPETVLSKPSGILQPPFFDFTSELQRIPLPEPLTTHAVGTPAYTLDLEMAEAAEMMSPVLPDSAARNAWLLRYRRLRAAMLFLGDDSGQKMHDQDQADTVKWQEARRDMAEVIAPLPADVRLYLEGAAAWIDGRIDVNDEKVEAARQFWRNVLAMPVTHRPWRSTWAAWMLFRTSPPAEQGRWLVEVRNSRQAGLKDALHLGIEATYILGRPASDFAERAQISASEWKRAAILRALLGLDDALKNLRHDRWEHTQWSKELAAEVLADPFLRRVQLLHLIDVAESMMGWEQGIRKEKADASQADLSLWLESFENAGIKDQQEAVHLAWVYYNAARFPEARRWLALAPVEDVNALSLRGKLAAMRGDKAEAGRQLARLASLLPESQDESRAAYEQEKDNGWAPLHAVEYAQIRQHHMLADNAVVQLARNDFAGALQSLLRTDYWWDAAYVAERLLSVEELLSLSRAGKLPALNPPSVSGMNAPSLEGWELARWEMPPGMSPFAYLVARRLLREGYAKEAARLLPPHLAAAATQYGTAQARAKDRRLTKPERAAALWTAAQLQRKLGMELFAYETAPDHALCNGHFDMGDMSQLRCQKSWIWADEWSDPPDAASLLANRPIFPATGDERWRLRHYGAKVNKRYHYRYTAAELAWQAAAMLPDDQEQTARVLGIAGSWLKKRDPKSADRFYKAMVRRNPNVPLAQEADQKRWFPAIEWSFEPAQPNVTSR